MYQQAVLGDEHRYSEVFSVCQQLTEKPTSHLTSLPQWSHL